MGQYGPVGVGIGLWQNVYSGSGSAPFSTPALSTLSVSGNTVTFAVDADNTTALGDIFVIQAQVTGGNWSSVYSSSHTIIQADLDGNGWSATLSLPVVGNTYDSRVDQSRGSYTSAWGYNASTFTTTTTYTPTYYFLGF